MSYVKRVNVCLTSNLAGLVFQPFEVVAGEVDAVLTTDLHDFGAEHHVVIGNMSARLSARAYFNTEVIDPKIMRRRIRYFDREEQVDYVHRQLLAYLFTAYVADTNDSKIGLDALNALRLKFSVEAGPVVDIIQAVNRQRYRQSVSVRHVTRARGRIPGGIRALSVVQAGLKGATAVGVTGPDVYDLGMETGNTEGVEEVLWYEEGRVLNWLGLLIGLGVGLVMLTGVRLFLGSVAVAEIAGRGIDKVMGEKGPQRFRLEDVLRVAASAEDGDGGELASMSSFSTWDSNLRRSSSRRVYLM